MSNHTKEPWYFDQKNTCVSPVSDDQLEICSITPIDATAKEGKWFMFGEQSEANARRIVACVNACAGFATDDLEKIVLKNALVSYTFDGKQKPEKQRDELLAAAKKFANAYYYDDPMYDLYVELDKAIASVEGKV